MKKYFSIILASLILVSSVACGQSGDKKDTGTTAAASDTQTETTALTDGLPDTDMQGFTLNILHHNQNWLTWAETVISADEENGDLINDAMYKRNNYIEDRFNCNLNIVGVDTVSSVFKQSVLSGENEYDIFMQYGIEVLGNTEYLSSFTNIPKINLEADYWNPDATSIFRIGDKQVAIAGNYTLSYLSGSACLLFNKELYSDLQIKDDIYGLVRDGKWTTDKFFEIAALGESDINGDSTMDANDRYGATGAIKAFYNTLITGAGIKYIQMDKESYPYFDVKGNEKTIGFFQKLVDAVTNDANLYYNDASDVNSSSTLKFENGQSFFIQLQVHGIQKYRDMETDFGIVPAPKYDEAQSKYYSYTNIGEIATLPRTFDTSRAENVGTLLEAMAFYSQNNIVPVYKQVVLQTKYTRDEESPEMLQYVFDGISFDYGIVVWQDIVGNVFMNNVFKPKSSTISSTVDSISTSLDASIEKLKASITEMP